MATSIMWAQMNGYDGLVPIDLHQYEDEPVTGGHGDDGAAPHRGTTKA